MRWTRATFLTGLAALACAGTALGQAMSGWSRIGVAASVRGLVKAALPGAAGRVITTGKPLFAGDRVTTGPNARLQILLADESTFLIGPNSEMVLDDFVYDPGHSAGRMAARFVRGVFRFISGRISAKEPEKVKIALPLGTIGVRGTVVLARIGPDGGATVVLGGPGRENDADARAGRVVVTGAGRSVELWRPGFGTELGKDGPGPARSMPEELGNIMRDIAPRPAAGEKGRGRAASKASDEETAMARETLAALRAPDSSVRLRDKDSLQAIQDLAVFGDIATWEQLASLQGSATFSGSSSFNVSGGVFGNTGTMSLALDVSFTNRTYGSSVSFLTLSYPGLAPGGQLAYPMTSFSGKTGPAAVTQAGGPFDGTLLSFRNTGGRIAGEAQVDLHFVNTTSPFITGTGTGHFPRP